MTYLLSKSSPSQPLPTKALPNNSLRANTFPSTGSDLLDTLHNLSPAPEHETLFEQGSAHGLGLQNIEIPQLASQATPQAALSLIRHSPEKTAEALSKKPLPSPRDRALERIHRTIHMDRAAS